MHVSASESPVTQSVGAVVNNRFTFFFLLPRAEGISYLLAVSWGRFELEDEVR